jgi:hypothetical protein
MRLSKQMQRLFRHADGGRRFNCILVRLQAHCLGMDVTDVLVPYGCRRDEPTTGATSCGAMDCSLHTVGITSQLRNHSVSQLALLSAPVTAITVKPSHLTITNTTGASSCGVLTIFLYAFPTSLIFAPLGLKKGPRCANSGTPDPNLNAEVVLVETTHYHRYHAHAYIEISYAQVKRTAIRGQQPRSHRNVHVLFRTRAFAPDSTSHYPFQQEAMAQGHDAPYVVESSTPTSNIQHAGTLLRWLRWAYHQPRTERSSPLLQMRVQPRSQRLLVEYYEYP